MQIVAVLQETVPELCDLKCLKIGQNLHANMEGFRKASHILCNTLTPQIKGRCGATNLMFPFAPGQHHDVAPEGGIPFL